MTLIHMYLLLYFLESTAPAYRLAGALIFLFICWYFRIVSLYQVQYTSGNISCFPVMKKNSTLLLISIIIYKMMQVNLHPVHLYLPALVASNIPASFSDTSPSAPGVY